MKYLIIALIALFGVSVSAIAAEAPKAPVKQEQVQKKKQVKKAKKVKAPKKVEAPKK